MALETITVKAAKQDKKVVLHERHPDHPGGEAFIHGNDTVHEVAHTAAIKKAIHEETLVKAAGKPGKPPKASQLTKIPGVGPALAAKLSAIGINTFRELAAADEAGLAESLGVSAEQAAEFKQAGADEAAKD